MKASEVLKCYAQGERNFQRVNLRGQSFIGADLSGADFSEADIRGTNFKNAILRESKFCGAKAGLQKHWTLILLIVSWIMSGVAGFLIAFAPDLVSFIFDSSPTLDDQIGDWVSLGVWIVIFAVIRRQRLEESLFVLLDTFFVVHSPILFALSYTEAGVLAVAFAGVLALSIVGVFAVSIVGAFAVAGCFAVAFAGVFAGVFAGAFIEVWGFREVLAVAVFFAFSAFGGVSVSGYVVVRTTHIIGGLVVWLWVRSIAVAFASTGGTSFYNADLTDADFTGATLKSTDLRAKSLTPTCFDDTIELNLARLGVWA
ncbi:pentapeptide repeat-containing protein [Gloeothece citriformis]|uniref:pentapeptide repeat-containing protein n=1 Tax=Gloeothece citriformis TaxID=2546356 RepID=UPI000173BF72|nr:pentapeptide repeat-containing protein [Gloeothece citriformis]